MCAPSGPTSTNPPGVVFIKDTTIPIFREVACWGDGDCGLRHDLSGGPTGARTPREGFLCQSASNHDVPYSSKSRRPPPVATAWCHAGVAKGRIHRGAVEPPKPEWHWGFLGPSLRTWGNGGGGYRGSVATSSLHFRRWFSFVGLAAWPDHSKTVLWVVAQRTKVQHLKRSLSRSAPT